MINKMPKKFAEAEVKPIAQQIDETCEFPWETVKKMGELGLMGMPYPEEYEGGDTDTLAADASVYGMRIDYTAAPSIESL